MYNLDTICDSVEECADSGPIFRIEEGVDNWVEAAVGVGNPLHAGGEGGIPLSYIYLLRLS